MIYEATTHRSVTVYFDATRKETKEAMKKAQLRPAKKLSIV